MIFEKNEQTLSFHPKKEKEIGNIEKREKNLSYPLRNY